MKKLEFPTKYTDSVQVGTFEYNNKPSMTEPDNAMSIPEIIARFTRGYGIPVDQHQWTFGSASEEGEQVDTIDNFWDDFKPAQIAPQEPAQEPAPDPSSTAASAQQQAGEKQEGE